SSSLDAALNLLRFRILIDEKQAESAWNMLVQAGHKLIESRGRYDATDLVRLLRSQNIRLSEALLPVAKNRYQRWLSEYTGTFTIPGPSGLSLPINTAWVQLHVLDKKVG